MNALADAPPAQAGAPSARIEELKKTVSASRLNCWQTCRLKFYFRYVLRIKRPKSAALFIGSMVHLVLQQWNLARWRNIPFKLDSMRGTFDTKWTEGQKEQPIDWEGEEPAEKQSSWGLLDMYFKQTPIPADEKRSKSLWKLICIVTVYQCSLASWISCAKAGKSWTSKPRGRHRIQSARVT